MFGVTSKKASDQDWGLDELGTMVSDLAWGEVSSPLTPVSSTCTEASAVCGCWHPLPMLYSSGQGEPEKPRTWGGVHQPQSPHSPTHSQVHCKKQPLPPGMASLWPLREETRMPITLAGPFPLPDPHFRRPSPCREDSLLAPATGSDSVAE